MTSTCAARCRGPIRPEVFFGGRRNGWLAGQGFVQGGDPGPGGGDGACPGPVSGIVSRAAAAVPCSPWSSAPRARAPSRARYTSQASTVAVIRAADSQADLIAKSCEGNLPMPQSSRCGYVLDPDVDPVGVDVAGFARLARRLPATSGTPAGPLHPGSTARSERCTAFSALIIPVQEHSSQTLGLPGTHPREMPGLGYPRPVPFHDGRGPHVGTACLGHFHYADG